MLRCFVIACALAVASSWGVSATATAVGRARTSLQWDNVTHPTTLAEALDLAASLEEKDDGGAPPPAKKPSVYIFGGYKDNAVLDSVAVLKPGAAQWTTLPSMPQRRADGSEVTLPFVVFPIVLLLGGELGPVYHAGTSTKRVSVFLPRLQLWLPGVEMNTARSSHSCAQQGSLTYCAGGIGVGSTAAIASFEVFDLTTLTWTDLPDMPVALLTHQLSVLNNGTLLVTGGLFGGGPYQLTASTWLYHPSTATWTAGEPLPLPLAGHRAVAVLPSRSGSGPQLALIGGANSNQASSTTTVWLTQDGKWKSEPVAPAIGPVVYPAVSPAGNSSVFVLGGYTPSQPAGSQLAAVLSLTTNKATALPQLPFAARLFGCASV
eukprot:m.14799 g.14799  ORF g.14799 m.14799 type:complete len:377 (-) comp4899_c0_seq1:325-1455(-)